MVNTKCCDNNVSKSTAFVTQDGKRSSRGTLPTMTVAIRITAAMAATLRITRSSGGSDRIRGIAEVNRSNA